MEQSPICTQALVLLCLNDILNPTCLMRFETEAQLLLWAPYTYFYVCMYMYK